MPKRAGITPWLTNLVIAQLNPILELRARLLEEEDRTVYRVNRPGRFVEDVLYLQQ